MIAHLLFVVIFVVLVAFAIVIHHDAHKGPRWHA